MKGLTARIVALVAAIGVLLALEVAPTQAAFPGENGKIVFESASRSAPRNLVAINPDGTGLTPLTDNSRYEYCYVQPSWSADGMKLAFAQGCISPDALNQQGINYMDPNGSGQINVSHEGSDPAWSPDGRRLVFVDVNFEDERFTQEIYVMNADGTGRVRLTHNTALEAEPVWSPDGTRIAFTSDRDAPDPGSHDASAHWEIYTMRPDGGDVRRLTANSVRDSSPDWSPDGSRIAFTSAREPIRPGSSELNFDVYAMNADGTAVDRLTTNTADNFGIAFDASPAWSPDGTRIAFVSGRHALPDPERPLTFNTEIFTMMIDGSDQRRVTDMFTIDGDPDWQPLPFKNASKKCKAFPGAYRNHGQCVKANR